MALLAIGNDLVWSVAFRCILLFWDIWEVTPVAANSIVNVVRNLGCVFCYGVGEAAGIIVGQILGSGDRERWNSSGACAP